MPCPSLPRRARSRPALVLLLAAGLLGACASTAPVVVSKRDDRVEIDARTRADIQHCTAAADRRVGRNALDAKTATQRAGTTAGVGFVGAAAGGLVSKSRGVWEKARGAAAAGAAGMLTKLAFEWNEGDEVYQTFVERCLEARGHEVLGWR